MASPDSTPDVSAGEAAWARWRHGLFVQRVRVGAALAAILVPAGWALDWFAEPMQAWTFLLIRLGFAVLFGAVLGMTWVPVFARRPGLLAFFLCVEIAVGIELLVMHTGGMRSEYYAGLMVLVIAAGVLFPWGAAGMGATCLAILGVHFLPAMLTPATGSWVAFGIQTYFLANGALVAIIAAYYGERARRREFDQRAELEARTGELREATGNLRETVEQLRELDRAKSRFFANVSHELRTPLTVILAVVETLEQEPLRGEVKERIRVLGQEAHALLRLINDLLTLVELDAGRAQLQRRLVDVNALVSAQVSEFAPLAERRGIHLFCRPEASAPLPADSLKLETAVRNLLSNALKFTPSGGGVRVTVREDEGAVVVEVLDTGPGIRREDQSRIFERFTRLPQAEREEVPGWGIGLSLVREVAVLHEGSVEVDSTPGRGARFQLRLPRVAATGLEERLPPPPSRPASSPPPSELGTLPEGVVWEPVGQVPEAPAIWKVLVAEDHAPLRHFLVGFLRRYYRVIEAADGTQALGRVRADRPDLVLADVMMPGLSGHDLVAAIRADLTTADTRVVLITAQRGTEAAVRGLSLGADDFLAKPFSPHELVARIGAQLRIRELDRSLAQAQKLATLGTLLAGLAHEIRNPVNVLVNGVPVLRRELPPSGGTAAEIIDVVEESARRVARIVDDLLGAARREEASVARWGPKDALERTLKLFAHQSQQITVVADLRYDGVIRGNPDRLDRVVMNLIDNAYRAMETEGGTLTVRCLREDAGVRIQFQDTGPGIPPDVLPRLFDPFFTTRRVGEGTGLGLHFCREIVQAHRGRLEARSGDHGAVFTVWLPQGEV